MAKLEGYTCDTCGEHGREGFLGGTPSNWYAVFPAASPRTGFSFCSKECLAAWATGKSQVAIPESKWVLLRKLVTGR